MLSILSLSWSLSSELDTLKEKMKILWRLVVSLILIDTLSSAHRFGYSISEQKMWKRKHKVGVWLLIPKIWLWHVIEELINKSEKNKSFKLDEARGGHLESQIYFMNFWLDQTSDGH